MSKLGRDRPAGAPLVGRRARLRPTLPTDLEFLFALATSEETGWRWRLQGHIPDPESFARDLWRDVLVQLVAEHRGLPRGVCVAYSPDLSAGHAHIGAAFHPATARSAVGEALVLFANYLFTTWNLDKLYIEIPEYNVAQVRHLLRSWCRHEGTLTDFVWYAGRHWDKQIHSVNRGDVAADLERLVGHATRTRASHVPVRPGS